MHFQTIGKSGAARKLADDDATALKLPFARETPHPGMAARARYASEAAWLYPLVGGAPAAVLAARTAEIDIKSRPGHHPREAGSASPPSRAALPGVLAALGCNDALSDGDAELIARLWKLARPTEELLACGGDDRLTLDPATGLNRYGCAPWPRPEMVAFGSCTASSLSAAAFAAAEKARRQLIEHAVRLGPGQAVAAATRATEAAILAYFKAECLADAILTASGTDAALMLTGLLAAEQPAMALTSVLVSASETGSGVPLAVAGCHFANFSPDGLAVEKGARLFGLSAVSAVRVVALRTSAGEPRCQADILADCTAAIEASLPAGRAVLHAIDGSKTGLAAPDRPALLRLKQQFGARLDIVIDACQARIEPALVHWYLSQGFPVLVTGSKFFAAPGFCGAVLFPRARLERIDAGSLAPGIAAYARLEGGIGSRRCPGLLLRWQAALHDMAAFACLPADEIRGRLTRFGTTVLEELGRDGRLRPIKAPRPAGMGWSDRGSVFTFTVGTGGKWLDMARLRHLYLRLQEDGGEGAPACQIGQPVELGDPTRGGLRIAASAAQITAGHDLRPQLRSVVARLGSLIDRGL